MNIIVSGAEGYIGSYFCEAAKRAGHEIVTNSQAYRAHVGVHLEWEHLPKYASAVHYANIVPRLETVIEWRRLGVQHIIVSGTCLEVIPNPPAYGRAKLILLEELSKLDIGLQWARLFNVYGGEREHSSRLVPKLRAAMDRGEKEFKVADAFRNFLHVRTVAALLLRLMESGEKGIFNIASPTNMFVRDFCRSLIPDPSMQFVEGFPLPEYEPLEIIP
jgi:UDP-glucuronate decarboxylase